MVERRRDISVVMATYNGSAFLGAQIDSILGQSLQAAEIVVCDDCSTDTTIDILKRYQECGVINYYINEQRLGVIANFKKAATIARKGNYIAFSDQDDIWLPEKLELSMKMFEKYQNKNVPAIVYSDPMVIDTWGNLKAPSLWNILGFDKYPHRLETIIFGNPAGGCTSLINPELSTYIPTIPDNTYMHDAWLTLCAYTFGKAYIIPQTLVKYRQHENNVTFSTSYVAKNRVKRILGEIKDSLSGKDSLFKEQFIFIRQFYEYFYHQIDSSKRRLFERFLELEHKSYFLKKIAFRKAAQGVKHGKNVY